MPVDHAQRDLDDGLRRDRAVAHAAAEIDRRIFDLVRSLDRRSEICDRGSRAIRTRAAASCNPAPFLQAGATLTMIRG
jgi:hypothetical protein